MLYYPNASPHVFFDLPELPFHTNLLHAFISVWMVSEGKKERKIKLSQIAETVKTAHFNISVR